jgi:hypothetical protein
MRRIDSLALSPALTRSFGGEIKRAALVTPVLDDWQAFAALLAEITAIYTGSDIVFHVCAVDDGSTAAVDPDSIALPADSCIAEIEILHLALNLGHQRAIAVGLCELAERRDIDAVVVMDSDGEDRPVDIASLLAAGRQHPGDAVLAHRAKRSEGCAFRLGYFLYKLLFRVLTGQTINFGNYSLLPMSAVRRLVRMPELWNNLPASLMRSRLPYRIVPTVRGERYGGRSRMNFVSLVVHGLSAMSVHTDTIFVRVLLGASLIAGLSLLGILAITIIRLATDLAIPGWATAAAGDFLIILTQTLVTIVATSLLMLARRSSQPIVPAIDAQAYLAWREQCEPRHVRTDVVA